MSRNVGWAMALLSISACERQGGENRFSNVQTSVVDLAATEAVTPVDPTCTTVEPVPVVTGLRQGGAMGVPWGLQVDDTHIYFIRRAIQAASITIERVPKTGGTPETMNER